jgi:hypothetical protein
MIITIDTTKESPEDLKKVIRFLESLSGESQRAADPLPVSPDLGVLFSNTETKTEEKLSPTPKEESEEIRIIPY